MEAKIKKNIEVFSVQAFLTLTKKEDRRELKEFIDSDFQLYEEDIINDRIKFYLKKIHIIDEDGHLTTQGEKFRQTGLLPVKYQGKYQIYYVKNEPLLEGNRVLYIEPSSPRPIDKQQVNESRENFNDDIFFLPEYENVNMRTFGDKQNGNGNQNDNGNQNIIYLDLEIRLKDKQVREAYFKTNDEKHPFKQKETGKDLLENNYAQQLQKDAVIKFFKEKIENSIFSQYDEIEDRLYIGFSEIANDSEAIEKFTFSREFKDNDCEISIKHIDLYPLTDEDALKWREKLAEIYLSRNYYTKEDLISELAKPQFEEIINKKINLEGLIKNNDLLKWHYYAPNDLNPNIPKNLVSDQVTLQRKQQFSLVDLITKLNLSGKYAAVLYYDKYIKNYWQKRAIALLLNFIDAENKIVITDKEGDYSDFENQGIDVFDIKEVFEDKKAEHDRFLILLNNNEIVSWKFSNSIDFLRFNDRKFDIHTPAKVQTNVTFTRLRSPEENTPKTLLDFLKSKIS